MLAGEYEGNDRKMGHRKEEEEEVNEKEQVEKNSGRLGGRERGMEILEKMEEGNSRKMESGNEEKEAEETNGKDEIEVVKVEN